MERHCCGDGDESFLLDDDNTMCDRCGNRWSIGAVAAAKPWPDAMAAGLEEPYEDAPLLINDCYVPTNERYHCHDPFDESHDHNAWKKLGLASVFCFIFMLAELVGGYLAGSLAVMTDAAHLFSDFIGFQISLLAIWIAKRAPTHRMTFGFYRAEVLGAFLSVLTVWLLAGIFAGLAINRLWRKEYEIDASTMITVASLGLIVNLVMGAILHGVCHQHQHILTPHSGPDHDHENINVRAASAHVLGDVLQSLGVLIAALIIKLFPQAVWADAVCTLLFSVLVICTTTRVVCDSIRMLLEGSPIDSYELGLELNGIAKVRHVHELHIWSLAPGKDVVVVHLAVDDYCDRDTILKKANTIIKNRCKTISCSIQIETYDPDLVNGCKRCTDTPQSQSC